MRHRRSSRDEMAVRAAEYRRARIRGLKFTLLGFLSALVVMVAARVRYPNMSLRSPMMVLGALAVGTLIMIAIVARRDD